MTTLSLRTLIADNRRADSLANRFRRARGDIFRDFLSTVPRPCRILDVGGTENFWIQSGLWPLGGVTVTLLNIHKEPVTQSGMVSVVGSATDLSRWGEGEFDVAFSNSVIEHVGSPLNQERMACEMMRVGKRIFLQTPARYFPIEPHFQFPLFWCLPAWLREKIVCTIPLGWYPKQRDRKEAQEFLQNFLLLTKKSVKQLFPQAEIIEERLFGFTKAYIALG